MSQAWKILLALTFARMTMGFQFQSVPALAAPIMAEEGMGFAALGALTGAYLLPGALVALTGGWLAQRLGDARIALFGLGCMTLGGFAIWWATSYEMALTARMVAGIGAVGLNVMVTKMAADWFQSRDDLPTAMGVLVSSWPAGIALAALALPVAAATTSLDTAFLVSALLCAAGWLVLLVLWREPERPVSTIGSTQKSSFSAQEWMLVTLAGMIWGTYNVALIGSIAWTPDLLQAKGFGAVAAAAAASVIGWTAIFSVAIGGWVATRAASQDMPALATLLASAALLAAMPFLGATAGSLWVMICLGLAIGIPAATIMTLPVAAARPQVRALAMGVYFAIYYLLMGLGPAALGILRETTGTSGSPHIAASALLILCLPMWLVFRRVQAAHRDATG